MGTRLQTCLPETLENLKSFPTISGSIMTMKTLIITLICLAGLLSLVTSQSCGERRSGRTHRRSRCVDVERCPPPEPTPSASGNTTHCFGFADIGYSCVPFDACIFGGL